jgi:hypothetical protein
MDAQQTTTEEIQKLEQQIAQLRLALQDIAAEAGLSNGGIQ